MAANAIPNSIASRTRQRRQELQVRAQLLEPFRLLVQVLWWSKLNHYFEDDADDDAASIRGGDENDAYYLNLAVELVDYLRSHGVTCMSDLAIFGTVLSQDWEALRDSNTALYALRFKLWYICEYVRYMGVEELEDLKDMHIEIERDICKQEAETGEYLEREEDYDEIDGLTDEVAESVHQRNSRVQAGYPTTKLISEELLTVWRTIWPDCDEEYGKARQLLNYFRRRGIYDLEGLAVFRLNHFEEAMDECKPFQRQEVVKLLGWICKFIAENNFGPWFDDICGEGMNPEKGRREILRRIDNASNGVVVQQIQAVDMPIVDLTTLTPEKAWVRSVVLFNKGSSASTLEQLFPCMVDLQDQDFCIEDYTAPEDEPFVLNVSSVSVMEKLLPKCNNVTLDPPSWTMDGLLLFFASFPRLYDDLPRLKCLDVSIPVYMTRSSKVAQLDLTRFIATKPASLSALYLKGRWDLPSPRSPEEVESAYNECLKAIVNGVTSDGFAGLDELHLVCFDVESLVYNEEERNPLVKLLSSDMFHSLDIELNSDIDDEPQEHWKGTSKQANHDLPDVPLGLLNLYNFYISKESWEEIWTEVSRLKYLENVAIAPGHRVHGTESIEFAISKLVLMPNLKRVMLGPQYVCRLMDVTSALAALLKIKSLETLEIDSEGFDSNDSYSDFTSYKLNSFQLLDSLEKNVGLKALKLNGVHLGNVPQQKSLARALLDVLLCSNNTTLVSIIVLGSESGEFRRYTVESNWREDPYCVPSCPDKADAIELFQLTQLNRFGRGRLQGDPSSGAVEELIKLVTMVKATEYDWREEGLVASIIDTARARDTSTNAINTLYEKLLCSRGFWKRVIGSHAETLGILFGLLRGNPNLWCLPNVRVENLTQKRKRQRIK